MKESKLKFQLGEALKQKDELALELRSKEDELKKIQKKMLEKNNRNLALVNQLNQVTAAKGQIAGGLQNGQGESGAQQMLDLVGEGAQGISESKEQLAEAKTINAKLQEQVRSSLSYIQTLEAKTKTVLQEKIMCEDQLSTLKQRERSDRQSIQSLQQILQER